MLTQLLSVGHARAAALLAAAVVVLATLWLSPSSPMTSSAAALSCAESSVAEMVQRGDVTVEGEVIGFTQAEQARSSSDPVIYTVAVERVHGGSAHETIEVEMTVGTGLTQPVVATRHLLVLTGSSPHFTGDLCASVALPPYDEQVAADIEALDWSAPEPGGADPDGPDTGARFPTLGVALGAVALASVLILVVSRRRQRI